jgi:hypothetical protein
MSFPWPRALVYFHAPDSHCLESVQLKYPDGKWFLVGEDHEIRPVTGLEAFSARVLRLEPRGLCQAHIEF